MTNEQNNLVELQERFAKLEISLGRGKDGVITAYTTAEPLFCFDGNTFEEVDAQVEDSLRSYAKLFYSLDIALKPRPGAEHLPIERLNPVDRYVPELQAA